MFPGDPDTSFEGITRRILDTLAESGLINDRAAGSVVRTLVESFARELATFYAILHRVHAAGYLETAEGPALDQVVAILGIRRARAGQLSGSIELSRLTPAPEDIAIFAGTRITGPQLPQKPPVPVLEIVEDMVLPRGELRIKAKVREIPGTDTSEWPSLPPETLSLMPKPLLGIESVTQREPIGRGRENENDDSLRARARAALREAQRGTVEAIEAAAREQGVSQVTLVEPPDGPAGDIKLIIRDPGIEKDPVRRQAVTDSVKATKAAGVRIELTYPRTVYVAPFIVVEPEDPQLDGKGFEALKAQIGEAVAKLINGLPAGTSVNRRKLDAVLLGQPGVREAVIKHIKTYFLQYPDDPKGTPTAQEDENSGKRETPNGDCYIGPLENAAVDLKLVPIPITRGEKLQSRVDVSVVVLPPESSIEALRGKIRDAMSGYLARLKPVSPENTSSPRRIEFVALEDGLSDYIEYLKLAVVVREHSGLAETLNKGHSALVQVEESITPGHIDITVEKNP